MSAEVVLAAATLDRSILKKRALSPWGQYFIGRWADGLPIARAIDETLVRYPYSEPWLRMLAKPLLGR